MQPATDRPSLGYAVLLAFTPFACGDSAGRETAGGGSDGGISSEAMDDDSGSSGRDDGGDEAPGSTSPASGGDGTGPSSDSDGNTDTDATGSDSDADAESGTNPPPEPMDLPCEREFELPGFRGLRACESTFEGYQVKFVPIAEGRAARHVSVYFHGDTAQDWEEDWYWVLAEWSYDHDVVHVSARSEAWAGNDGDQWRVWYNTDQQGTDDFVGVLDLFKTAYAVQSPRVLYSGASGGSIYLAGRYLGWAGHVQPGAFVANCGAPNVDILVPPAWDFTDDSLRSGVDLFFNYGSEDFLADQIDEAYAYYSDRDFQVTRDVVQGADHCALEIDSDDKTMEFWEAHLE